MDDLYRIRVFETHEAIGHLASKLNVKMEDVTSTFILGAPGHELNDSRAATQQSRSMETIRVFISHSSEDAELAKPLIDLLRKALHLQSDDIRCTSVDGYRMQAGASIDDRLRAEVHDAELLVCLVTPNSLDSAYVIFELGARWGAEKPMIPLLASGVTPGQLGGPLSGINALNSRDIGQVHQLLEDAAKYLNLSLDKTSSYSDAVNDLVQLSLSSTAVVEQQSNNQVDRQLSKDARELLLELAIGDSDSIEVIWSLVGLGISTSNRVFAKLGDIGSDARWMRALEELEQDGLVEALSYDREEFQLTDSGFKMADTLNEGQKATAPDSS